MKKYIALLLAWICILIFTGCNRANNEGTISEPTENTPVQQDVLVSEEIDEMIVFSDLEHFQEYLFSTDNDITGLHTLERYYLPAGIPEEYQIYKITAGSSDIGFWYLPEQNQTSPGAMLDAESQKKHFLFIMMQDDYDLDTVLASFSNTDVEPQSGKYFLQTENMVIWQKSGTVLLMYLPEGYEVTDLDALCQVEKYTGNTDSGILEASQDG